jgi:hypothetical protein
MFERLESRQLYSVAAPTTTVTPVTDAAPVVVDAGPTADATARRAGDKPGKYMVFVLKEVIVTGVTHGGTSEGGQA